MYICKDLSVNCNPDIYFYQKNKKKQKNISYVEVMCFLDDKDEKVCIYNTMCEQNRES